MSRRSNAVVITPRRGTRPFRRNARIAVADGSLILTDRRKRSSTIRLDGTPESPEYLIGFYPDQGKGRLELVIADGQDRSFVVCDMGAWESLDVEDIEAAAGLKRKTGGYPPGPGPLRGEGISIRDSDWWRWGPVAGPVGLAAAMTSNAGVVPRGVGLPLLLVCFFYLMSGLALGAYTGRRPLGVRSADWAGSPAKAERDRAL